VFCFWPVHELSSALFMEASSRPFICGCHIMINIRRWIWHNTCTPRPVFVTFQITGLDLLTWQYVHIYCMYEILTAPNLWLSVSISVRNYWIILLYSALFVTDTILT
jgi:hypothetical protein